TTCARPSNSTATPGSRCHGPAACATASARSNVSSRSRRRALLARVDDAQLRAHGVERRHDAQRLVERHDVALGASVADAAVHLVDLEAQSVTGVRGIDALHPTGTADGDPV